MTATYFTNPLVFLVQTLFGLYITIVVIRFLLQWAGADFYNPLSQFIVKATSPLLRPLRRVVPGYRGLDVASLVLAWLLKSVELMILAPLFGLGLQFIGPFAWAVPDLVGLVISIFLFMVLIRVVLSWVNPDPYNPAVAILTRLTDPLLLPAQRILPPMGGIDLSPMLVMIALVLLQMLLIPPLRWVTGSPF